jgi:hypothetical protein
MPKNEQDQNYEMTLLQSTLISCKIMEGTRANFVIKMLMDDFDKYFNFNFTCPFPKQTFGMYNFMPNEKFLPQILQNRKFKFALTVKFDGKLINIKKTVWLFTFRIIGVINSIGKNA